MTNFKNNVAVVTGGTVELDMRQLKHYVKQLQM
jgi:hypothetical protein